MAKEAEKTETEEKVLILKSSPLFCRADGKTLSEIARECGEVTFRKGGELSELPPSLCVILKGKVNVSGKADAGKVSLNTIGEGGVFGAARLFGGLGNVTSVKAAEKCEVLVIPQAKVEELFRKDPEFALGYVEFLSGKIRFLNEKIASFTSGCSENKLARFLLSKTAGDGEEIDPNMSRLAGMLDVSRASLYRAADSLCKKGLIRKDGGRITVLSYEKLKNIYGGKEK